MIKLQKIEKTVRSRIDLFRDLLSRKRVTKDDLHISWINLMNASSLLAKKDEGNDLLEEVRQIISFHLGRPYEKNLRLLESHESEALFILGKFK